MNKKIAITVITDIDDLIRRINDFADNITGNDIAELPHINNALEEWKQKNLASITAQEFSSFIKMKKRIENLMDEFKIVGT